MTNRVVRACLKIRKKRMVTGLFFFCVLASCTGNQHENHPDARVNTIPVHTDLVIGLEGQPLEHQFGRPEAVRVDEDGNIYVADRASMEIKVFDRDGNYTKSLGGRGRGPGEFQDIELMEWTPEGNLVVMDRGNMRYMVLSTDGDEIDTFPYNLSDQFYPKAVRYVDGKILALFYNSSSRFEVPDFERDIFYIYSPDFQHRQTSFTPVRELGFDEMFLLNVYAFYPGSLALPEEKDAFVFSPSTYTGALHLYRKRDDGGWEREKILQGTAPGVEPYELYGSVEEYERAAEAGVARATLIWYGGDAYTGRQLSMDAGVFYLDDGRIVHFYAEWKEGYDRMPDSQSHPMDLYVQIFNREGELQEKSYLFTYTEQFDSPYFSNVNAMDGEKNFYLFDYPGEVPTVRRFSLELPD